MRSRYLILVFAIFHFAVIVCGVAEFTPSSEPLKSILSIYGGWSGNEGGYGFFAPSIPNQVMVYVTSIDARGHLQRGEFHVEPGEPDLRLMSLVFFLSKLQLNDLLARTVAAYALGTRPNTERVVVDVGKYVVPSMVEMRRGRQCHVDFYYSGTFARRRR